MVDPTTSLRERSKARRRAAIQRAALSLFAERGYERATIAEIAEAAELATRTVTMYFPTKMDIATSVTSDLAARLTATFRAYPDLSFSDVLNQWLTGERESADPDLAALTTAMFEANPALRAVSTAHVSEAAGRAGDAFVAELGLTADHPMVKIVGAAIGASISEYLSARLLSEDSQREFMRYIRAIIAAARPA
jgi:AcrR family transcriptional regulator